MKKLAIIIVLGLAFQYGVLPTLTAAGTDAMQDSQESFSKDKAAFIDSRVNG